MAFDITSSNAKLVLKAAEIFPAGITLEQFSADTSYSSDNVAVAEARMGVDGKIAIGQTPTIKQVSIQLEACSPSNKYLAKLHKAMDSFHKPFECTLIATIPSLGITMTWSTGALVSGTPVPSGQRVLSPTQWVFNFQDYTRTGD